VVLGVADAWPRTGRAAQRADATASAAATEPADPAEPAAWPVTRTGIVEGIANVLSVLVWPVLLGFVVWRLERQLGALLDALTARLRGAPPPS
jgi:hypothetical protein